MMVSAPDILNASILIVDDQESNVSLLEQLLSEAGYACVASTMNPQDVCALHPKNRYDLIRSHAPGASGHRGRVIALIDDPGVVRRILEHLGALGAQARRARPACAS